MFKKLAVIAALLATFGCGTEKDLYDSGYSDGYAVGYNTACKIRATLISGTWEDPRYSEGYSEGVTAGMIDAGTGCNKF